MINQHVEAQDAVITESPPQIVPLSVRRVERASERKTIAQMSYEELRERARESAPPQEWFYEVIPANLLG
jgi:hypothetical protein